MIVDIKSKNLRVKRKGGFSLIELLVVVFVFSILTVVTTRSLAVSLRGSSKSNSTGTVKENIEFAAGSIERQLRNARSIDQATSSTQVINYVDENGLPASFSCVGGANGYIVSTAGRITSSEVNVNCTISVFQYTPATTSTPPSVLITISATHALYGSQIEGSAINIKSRVQLRSY